jgi:hypothetical protein
MDEALLARHFLKNPRIFSSKVFAANVHRTERPVRFRATSRAFVFSNECADREIAKVAK